MMKEIKNIFSEQLRSAQTTQEEKVWELLRDRKLLGLKFRRQFVIEGFIVDFYCPELRIAIEIDGGIHDKRKEYDLFRQSIIESEGIKFIRIPNKDTDQPRHLLANLIEQYLLSMCKTNEVLPLPSRAKRDMGEGVSG